MSCFLIRDLVCDKSFHPTLALVLLSVGEVLGTPVFGTSLSDINAWFTDCFVD